MVKSHPMKSRFKKERRFNCGALLWVVLGLWLFLSCSSQSSEQHVSKTRDLKIVPVFGDPIKPELASSAQGIANS